MTQSDDFLDQPNSPTREKEFTNNYVFRLRFDGDVWEAEFETYEIAVNDLKKLIKENAEFDICIIEQYEIDLFTTDVFYTLDKNEYITKVGRYLQLESAQWELSSDEVVEQNQLRTYLNFNL